MNIKTRTEKLNIVNGLPKTMDLSVIKNHRWGRGMMYIQSPLKAINRR